MFFLLTNQPLMTGAAFRVHATQERLHMKLITMLKQHATASTADWLKWKPRRREHSSRASIVVILTGLVLKHLLRSPTVLIALECGLQLDRWFLVIYGMSLNQHRGNQRRFLTQETSSYRQPKRTQ